MTLRIGSVALVCCHLLLTPGLAVADECDKTADCPEDFVCANGECLSLPPACAEFCENAAPCFKSAADPPECVGSGYIGDVMVFFDSGEYCDTAEDTVGGVVDECLSECASSFDEDGEDGWMADLIECMTIAEYDCDALESCIGAMYEDYNFEWYGDVEGWSDVVAGGEDAAGNDDIMGGDSGNGIPEIIRGDDSGAPGGDADDMSGAADTATSDGTGGSGPSCAASDSPVGGLPMLLAAVLVLLRRRRVSAVV